MGYKGWEAFVPFYNYYIIQKEVGEPKWFQQAIKRVNTK
jgi:signal peptidase I